MSTIYKEFLVIAPPIFVWNAIKDVGAVHSRLAKGFVSDTILVDGVRTVTFRNGVVARERIIAVDEEHFRLAYSSIGGQTSHHHASFQVFPHPDNCSRVLWITDLLPDDLRPPIEQMVEAGSLSIQQTLEDAYREEA